MMVDVFAVQTYITQEDLSTQIGEAHFTTNVPFHLGTLVVYWNGLKQRTADVEVLSPNTFRLNQNVIAGDNVMVLYQTC